MNLNKAFIIGNLTRDPEVRTLPSGLNVASFGMATNRFYTGKDGQKKNRTEIVVQSMQMGPRGAKTGAPETAASQPKEKEKEELDTIDYGEEEINPDEIPF